MATATSSTAATAAANRTSEFIHTIRVGWADCDPARIAYTGRIPYFALEAIDVWWENTIGLDWYRLNVDKDIGTPFVHLSIDFRKPVTPRHPLQCTVRLIRLGESSVRFAVAGRQDGDVCFEGQFVEVFVNAEAHVKRGIPEEFKTRLMAALEQAG
ncbi:MAG: thioesterase family protein [Rhizobiaceae bacterium]